MIWFLLALAAILAAVLLVPIWLEFCAGYPGERRAEAYVRIAFLKFDLLEKKDKKNPTEEKKNTSEEIKIRGALKLFGEIKEELFEILAYISQKAVRIKLLRVGIAYGTGDCASTGILYGIISGAVYGVSGALSAKTELEKADIEIEPDFYTAKINAEMRCIVKIRNAHIIIAAIKLLRLAKRIKNVTRRGVHSAAEE